MKLTANSSKNFSRRFKLSARPVHLSIKRCIKEIFGLYLMQLVPGYLSRDYVHKEINVLTTIQEIEKKKIPILQTN